VEPGGVEEGDVDEVIVEDHGEFGAAKDDRLSASAFEAADDFEEAAARGLTDATEAELVKDHPVDIAALGLVRYEGFDVEVIGKALDVEGLSHGVGGAEQSDGLDAGGGDGFADGIDDVEEGDSHFGLEEVSDHVDAVAGDDEEVGAGVFERSDSHEELTSDVGEVVGLFGDDDGGEIEVVEDARRGMEPAEAISDDLVQESIVFGGGFPTETAEQSDELH